MRRCFICTFDMFADRAIDPNGSAPWKERENEMKTIIRGRICGLLSGTAGEINGIVLDTGRRVRFSPDRASRVLSIAILGSLVEVKTSAASVLESGSDVEAIRVINLDSHKSASLSSPMPPNSPEVPSGDCLPRGTTVPLAVSPPLVKSVSNEGFPKSWVIRKQVMDEIEQAYDTLHRIQAMLVHLKVICQEQPATGQYLDEAKHTYVQALSHFQVFDFEAAGEFAAASSNLSRVVEILLSNIFRPSGDTFADELAVQPGLENVERLLVRIRWVTEHGTLPSEDRARVQKLTSWCADLSHNARCLLDKGQKGEALTFAQAADELARSVEHLCRECYVTRCALSQSPAPIQ